MDPKAFSLPDFCRLYNVSRSAAYRELRAGRLRAVKRGRRTLVEAAEAERWFRTLSSFKPTAA